MIDLLTGILATWRLTHLLYAGDPPEDGPFEMFAKIRDAAGVKFDEHSIPVSDNQIGKMLCCFWCTSVWAGLAVTGLQGSVSLRKVLAYSAGAILLEELRGQFNGKG